ncbi:MAG: primosomal protein N' [Candidatus Yanofskybacteria bacterium]|nr:primosomal protein N' [Candidatus Yanofskybacteria bacterium]
MFIVEVIPLTILPSNAPQILSYFFNRKLEKGAIVEIPLNNRKIQAVVTASSPLEDQKILLKKTGFQLKKISNVISETPQISNGQFKIALWLSKHYYAPLGYCLKTVLPPFFLKRGYETKIENLKLKIENLYHKPLFLLSNAKETLINLLPFIKKAVESRGQVALIVPDTSTIAYFYSALEKNYDVAKISHAISNRNLNQTWKKIHTGQTSIILGTRQTLFMPFKNLKLVIVDDVLHEFYKSDMTPKYNTPDLAKTIADLHGAKTIFVSPVTGVENYYYIKNKDYDLLDKIRPREPLKIINMVEEIKNGNFSLFSREFRDRLLSAINPIDRNPAPSLSADRHSEKRRAWGGAGKKILIFSPRRGHSGVLVCQNCGYAVKCKECGTAFRIHKTTDLVLVCHHCSRTLKMPKNCPNCNDLKLKTQGPAGTQKIYDEVQKLIAINGADKIPIQILDADVIKNETEEEDIIKEVQTSRTSMLIATQMVFSHRYNMKFDLIGVLNADSLISSPDFRIEERLFYQIEKLLDFLPAQTGQPKNIFIQTYNPENRAILTASEGNYKNFYDKELETRKIFSYPPHSRLIKLTFKHKYKDKASYEARTLSSKLKMAVSQLGFSQKVKLIDSHPSFIEKERGLFVYNIVLKILPELENIREILKYIPSNWSIDVDPVRLL